MESKRQELAKKYFMDGYNCCQAVVLSFSDYIDIDKKLLLRTVSSFGGGMGRLREVCGAVSGMFFVAGAICGYDDVIAREAKTEHYKLIQELAKEFKERNGSIVCRELLGVSGRETPVPEERTEAYYKKRPCIEMIGDAVDIVERKLVSLGFINQE